MKNSLDSQNILVLGAGELGMAVLRGLAAQAQTRPGVRLTVALRESALSPVQPANRARLADIRALGIDIATVDFANDSEETLAGLFSRYDAVINCSGFVGGPGTQLKITRCAIAAGVARYFPWQFGVDYDAIGPGSGQTVWDEQLEVRGLLRGQKATQWVIVSTGMFTSYLFEPDFGVVSLANRYVRALGDWENGLTLTTPDDIGRLTAAIFFHQPQIIDEVVYVAGDTLSWRALADLLEETFGVPFTRECLTVEELRAALTRRPADTPARYRLAFARKKGVSWDKNRTFNAREAIPVQDVRQWLVENRL